MSESNPFKWNSEAEFPYFISLNVYSLIIMKLLLLILLNILYNILNIIYIDIFWVIY